MAKQRKEREQAARKKNLYNIMNPQTLVLPIQNHLDDDEVDLTCSICMCELEPGEYIYNISCKHIFHIDCLEHWYSRKDICPLCKRHLDFEVTTEDCYTFNRSEYEKKLRVDSQSTPVNPSSGSVSIEMQSIFSICFTEESISAVFVKTKQKVPLIDLYSIPRCIMDDIINGEEGVKRKEECLYVFLFHFIYYSDQMQMTWITYYVRKTMNQIRRV